MAKKNQKKTVTPVRPSQPTAAPRNPTPATAKAKPRPEEKKPGFSLAMKLAMALGIIAFLVFVNTTRNGYVLDDVMAITKNNIVPKGISAIPEILTTPYRKGYFIYSNPNNDFYRPISLVMFAVECQFFGENPAVGHFMNVVIFAGCVMLLFLFLDQLFERRRTAVAFIAALLFALHPIHTEVVANIKSRDELLCFFFAFAGLNVFMRYLQTGKPLQLVLGAVCMLLSLMSKETTITFLAVVPLIFLFYRNEDKKRSRTVIITSVAATLVFLGIRYSILSAYNTNHMSNIAFIDNALAQGDLPAESRIATALLVLGYYLKLMFVPYPLISDYSYNSIPFVHIYSPSALLSLAIYAAIAVAGIRLFMKDKKNPYAFAIFFFFITITLFSNIPFLIGTIMGERLMFFPSIGFCLAVPLLVERLVIKTGNNEVMTVLNNKTIMAIFIPVALIFGALTIQRNSEWINNFTLYSADSKKAPGDARLYYDLGLEYANNFLDEKDTSIQRKNRDTAIYLFKKSLSIFPDYAATQSDLGIAYFRSLRLDSAEIHTRRAMELNPGHLDYVNNLAIICNAERKYKESIDLFRKVIAFNPDFKGVHTGIGGAFFGNNQLDSAEWHEMLAFRKLPPGAPEGIDLGSEINDLACAYFAQKQYPKAIVMYKNAIKLIPGNPEMVTNLAACYLVLGKFDSCIQCLHPVLVLNRGDSRPFMYMAMAFNALGRVDSARKYEAIVQKFSPGFKL